MSSPPVRLLFLKITPDGPIRKKMCKYAVSIDGNENGFLLPGLYRTKEVYLRAI